MHLKPNPRPSVGHAFTEVEVASIIHSSGEKVKRDSEPMTNDQIPTAEQQWITTKEAAEIIGVSLKHVTYLLRTGKVKGKKFGYFWMVDMASAEAYASADRKPGPKPDSA